MISIKTEDSHDRKRFFIITIVITICLAIFVISSSSTSTTTTISETAETATATKEERPPTSLTRSRRGKNSKKKIQDEDEDEDINKVAAANPPPTRAAVITDEQLISIKPEKLSQQSSPTTTIASVAKTLAEKLQDKNKDENNNNICINEVMLQRDLILSSSTSNAKFMHWIPHPKPVSQMFGFDAKKVLLTNNNNNGKEDNIKKKKSSFYKSVLSQLFPNQTQIQVSTSTSTTAERVVVEDLLKNTKNSNTNNNNVDAVVDLVVPPEYYAPLASFENTSSPQGRNQASIIQRLLTSKLKECLLTNNKAQVGSTLALQNTFIHLLVEDIVQRFKYRYDAMMSLKLLKQQQQEEESKNSNSNNNLPSNKISSPPSTTFSREDAVKCFRGKRLLFIGTSNTRTLMTNIQARLEGTEQMTRVTAKQLCDNSERNHTCFVRLENSDVELHYWGYKEDLYHSSLKARIDSTYEPRRMRRRTRTTGRNSNNSNNNNKKIPIDFVIMSTGINTIQIDANWNSGGNSNRRKKMKQLQNWIASQWFPSSEEEHDQPQQQQQEESTTPSQPLFQFIWHSVSPVCPNMPHFRKYRFRKSKWSNQPAVEVVTNKGTRVMNTQMMELFFPSLASTSTSSSTSSSMMLGNIRFLDSDGMLDILHQEDTTEIVDVTTKMKQKSKKQKKSDEDTDDVHVLGKTTGSGKPDEDVETDDTTAQQQHPLRLQYPNYMAGKGVPSTTSSVYHFPKYCLYYEDPLHHRFLDRVIVDTLMTMVC